MNTLSVRHVSVDIAAGASRRNGSIRLPHTDGTQAFCSGDNSVFFQSGTLLPRVKSCPRRICRILSKLLISVPPLAKLDGKAEATAGDDAADAAWFAVGAEDGPQTLTLVFSGVRGNFHAVLQMHTVPGILARAWNTQFRTVAVWLLTMP